MKVINVKLMQRKGKQIKLYVLTITQFKKDPISNQFNNQVTMFKFYIHNYKLEYKMNTITFKEDLKIEMEDFNIFFKSY